MASFIPGISWRASRDDWIHRVATADTILHQGAVLPPSVPASERATRMGVLLALMARRNSPVEAALFQADGSQSAQGAS